jgi:tight adherence protein C
VTLIVLLGISVGLSIATAMFALAPSPPPLRQALIDLHRLRQEPSRTAPGTYPILVRAARALGGDRLLSPRVRADLAITGHDEAWLFSSTLLVGLCGVALGPAIAIMALLLGVVLPWGIPLAFSVIAGSTSSLFQVISLRNEAFRRREDYAFALSAYLDLVVVSMAAGRGVEGALSVAAQAGSAPAFDDVLEALEGARLRGIAPWEVLDELGLELGVSELSGIAASIRLAGSSGARVRSSLAARAKALRERGLAESRAAAESGTERMSVPVVLLVLGFIVLIGYPAVVQITTQL